jgi:hypothetical protein
MSEITITQHTEAAEHFGANTAVLALLGAHSEGLGSVLITLGHAIPDFTMAAIEDHRKGIDRLVETIRADIGRESDL